MHCTNVGNVILGMGVASVFIVLNIITLTHVVVEVTTLIGYREVLVVDYFYKVIVMVIVKGEIIVKIVFYD